MAVSQFSDLAAEFCQLIGAPVPALTPDPDGVLAFAVTVGGVEFIVAHDPFAQAKNASIHVNFGSIPKDQELKILSELLQANLAMRQPQAPAFCLDGETGQVFLKYSYPLAGACAGDLWRGMQSVTEEVLRWRANFLLGEPSNLFNPGQLA